MKSKRLHLFYSSFSLLCLIFSTFIVSAQDEGFNCSQHIVTAKLYEEHPELKKQHQEYNQYLIKASKSILAEKKSSEKLIIPVVFNVIHSGGTDNISEAQIQDAIETLNLEFNAKNQAINQVDPLFKDAIGVADIEFRLATKDPNGNCTKGINRYFDSRTNSAGDEIKLGRQWPSNRYLNVYTVSRIASGAAGYAYFPGAPSNIDGIVIIHNYVGRIGTGNQTRSSALTHEVGHYLALYHVWGEGNDPGLPNNCLNDDDVEDTPNCAGTGQCNLNSNTCGQGMPGDLKDNVQNYMEYAYCYAMFTKGQVSRMRAALESNVGSRSNLWNLANLKFTGTSYDSVPNTLCKADFETNSNASICAGSVINFKDLSYFQPTSWAWEFEGGTPAVSNDQNPSITYNTEGSFGVTLTVTNSSGSVTISKKAYISVSPLNAQQTPYIQDFENLNNLGAEFKIVDNNKDFTWEKANYAGYKSTNSITLLNNYVISSNRVDDIIFKTLNLENSVNPRISFRYAFVAKANNNSDKLNVLISDNCGATYNNIKTISGQELRTSPNNNLDDFIPENESQWKLLSLDLNNFKKQGIKIKLSWTSGGGNNVFIDDINISESPNSINDPNSIIDKLYLYPNPNNGQFELNFSLLQDSKVAVELIDLLGKVAISYPSANYAKGQQTISLKSEGLPAGMYSIKVTANGAAVFKKVIIQ